MNVELVCRVLESAGARFCLIGGHAMAARGYPRFTIDIDLLTTDRGVLTSELWGPIERAGGTVDVRRGDDDDPLAGVVHILLKDATDIDVIVGRWAWQGAVIERAEAVAITDVVTLPVPLTSDLILLKLSAGGFLDLRDVAALLEIGDRSALIRDVNTHIADVRPDVRHVWEDLLRQT